MAQPVKFIYLSQSEYDALTTKEAGSIYFTSDTDRIYRGNILYATTEFDEITADSIEASSITIDEKDVATEEYVQSQIQSAIGDALATQY